MTQHDHPIMVMKKATLNPTVQMAQIKALAKSTVKYPMRTVDCKVYSITAGARTNTHENMFLGTPTSGGVLHR